MRPRRASEPEPPTTLRNYVLQNPGYAVVTWIFLCLMAVACLFADNGMHWSLPFAVLGGVPLGTIVWCLLTFGTARGWVDGDA